MSVGIGVGLAVITQSEYTIGAGRSMWEAPVLGCQGLGDGGIPGGLRAAEGVAEDEELAQAGDERDLGRLAGGDEALVKGLEVGVRRVAVSAAMESARRTWARPPQQRRRPRRVPLSRLNGATPTRAAICWREQAPSSGKSASRVAAAAGLMPGMRCSQAARGRRVCG